VAVSRFLCCRFWFILVFCRQSLVSAFQNLQRKVLAVRLSPQFVFEFKLRHFECIHIIDYHQVHAIQNPRHILQITLNND